MKSFNGVDGVLFTSEGNEGTGFTFSGAVPQHRAFLDGSVNAEHVPNVVLGELLRQHADEQLAFWKAKQKKEKKGLLHQFGSTYLAFSAELFNCHCNNRVGRVVGCVGKK